MELFLSIDSFFDAYAPGTGTTVVNETVVGSKLPRDGQGCCGGGMEPVHVPKGSLLNVGGFDAWLSTVEGVANRERATAWVDLLR